MYKTCEQSMKTSELEDQYVIIFALALWPQEPCDVNVLQKEFDFTRSARQQIQTNIQIGMQWV